MRPETAEKASIRRQNVLGGHILRHRTSVPVCTTRAARRRLDKSALTFAKQAIWEITMATSKDDFGKILIRRGIISRDQLNEAEQMAREQSANVADCLVKLGYATGEEVMRAMAEYHGLEYVDLAEFKIPEEVIELVPESVARENAVLPLSEEDDTLKVIVSDPIDIETFEKLRFILNRKVEIALAPREAILEAINRYYGQVEGESADSMLQEFTDTAIDFTETEDSDAAGQRRGRREQRPGRPAGAADDPGGRAAAGLGHPHRAVRGPDPHPLPDRRRARSSATAPPTAAWVPSSRASRFSPNSTSPNGAAPRTGGSRSPSARRNWTCASASSPPTTASRWSCGFWTRTASRSASASWVWPKTDFRKFQGADPPPQRHHPGDRPDRFRQDDHAVRRPEHSEPAGPEDHHGRRPGGVLPAGDQSGRDASTTSGSTSPASFAPCCGRPRTSSWWAKCEIAETASMGIQASLTGHLVFSTLHTNDAPSAVTRMIDMGVPGYLVASSVIAVMAQRLVRVDLQAMQAAVHAARERSWRTPASLPRWPRTPPS